MRTMTLGGRLRMLRTENGLTQDELRKKFEYETGKKLSASGLSNYENDKRFPDQQGLNLFCDFYGVSLDYIMGRTNDRKATTPPDDGLDKDNEKYKRYSEIYEAVSNKLVEIGINRPGQDITPDQLKLFLQFGEAAAIEILKSKGHDTALLYK